MMHNRRFISWRNDRKNPALRQRIGFLLLSAALLATLVQNHWPSIQEVHLSPEIRQILGEEPDTLFNELFHDLQIWYDSYPCTENGVTLTKERDYEKIVHLLKCAALYLNSYELEETDPNFQLVQEYNAPIGFFIVELTLSFIMILARNETYTISKEGWQELGLGIDDVIATYKRSWNGSVLQKIQQISHGK